MDHDAVTQVSLLYTRFPGRFSSLPKKKLATGEKKSKKRRENREHFLGKKER